ncbi:MAG: glycoside hydrolase N-terminal domain-containing protein, partial [Akkermansia sp.]|nr:glycoside hydrolase N-terminal domain-containing protein [Akkermansia sp.]
MTTRTLIYTLAICTGIATATEAPAPVLWYKQPAIISETPLPWATSAKATGNLPGKPAKNGEGKLTNDSWESQTLPIGNGRIGGTVYGGDHLDRINLNEVSLWTGGPNT